MEEADYQSFFSPDLPLPVPFHQLDDSDRTTFARNVPRPQPGAPDIWLSGVTSKTARSQWTCELSPGGSFDDLLLDDAFHGAHTSCEPDLRTAVAEMSQALAGLYVVPSATSSEWNFTNRGMAPLVWCTLALLVDQGNTERVQLAVDAGLPKAYMHVAWALLARTWALLSRARAALGGGDPGRLDAETTKTGLVFDCLTMLFPIKQQVLKLRPSATKALASALLALNVWRDDTLSTMSQSMLSALAKLRPESLENAYGTMAPAIRKLCDEQSTCSVGPPSTSDMRGRLHELPCGPAAAHLAGRILATVGDTSYAASLAVRGLMWNDPAALRFLYTDRPVHVAPSVWRAAAYADMFSPTCATTNVRYAVPPRMLSDLEARAFKLRAAFGGDIPLDVLLSCSPLGPAARVGSETLMPPLAPSEMWRRLTPASVAFPNPVVVDVAENFDAAMEHRGDMFRQQRIPLGTLCHSVGRPITRALIHGVGESDLEAVAGAFIVFRALGLKMGDRVWNLPGNFVFSPNAILVEADAARVLMIRALMMRLYVRPRCTQHLPFVTPIIAREMHTLTSVSNDLLRAELASALCDFIVAMLTLRVPTCGISTVRRLMTRGDINIALPGSDQPWAVTLCTMFLPRFLGPVTRENLPREFVCNNPVLYNGYFNTVLAMMRSPLDEDVGFWHWPSGVLDAILRYFFLVYMQTKDLVSDSAPVPSILTNNPVLVQALAFMYLHRKLRPHDVAAAVVSFNDGVYHHQKERATERKVARRVPGDDTGNRYTVVHLKEAAPNAIESHALSTHPVTGGSIAADIGAHTAAYADGGTIPKSLAPGDYSTLQFKYSAATGKPDGPRKNLRSIPRIIGLLFNEMTTVEDLATGMVEVSSAKEQADAHVPRGKGYLKRSRQAKEAAAAAMDVDAPSDSLTDDAPRHRRVAHGQYKARELNKRAEAPAPAPTPPGGHSEAGMFVSEKELDELRAQRIGRGRKKPVAHNSASTSDSDSDSEADMEHHRRRVEKLRRDRINQLRTAGASLSRFVILAITSIAASPTNTLPKSFVRAVLSTSHVIFGQASHPHNWENSALTASNRIGTLQTSMAVFSDKAGSAALPGVYPSPAGTSSEWSDLAFNSLFDMELAPFTTRSAIVGHPTRDFYNLHNGVPGIMQLERFKHWDIPVGSVLARGDSDHVSPVYPYSLPFAVTPDFVRDAVRPSTTMPADGSGDREKAELDAPYDFRLAIWMSRCAQRGVAPALGPGSGVGLISRAGDTIVQHLK